MIGATAVERDYLLVSSSPKIVPPKKYAYDGYLLPYLPRLSKLRADGMTALEAVEKLIEDDLDFKTHLVNYYNTSSHSAARTLTYVEKRLSGWNPGDKRPNADFEKAHAAARREHVLILDLQGLRQCEIARRLGVSATFVHHVIYSDDWQRRRAYKQAAEEHAWLLAAEGLLNEQIEVRLNKYWAGSIPDMIHDMGERVQQALRSTKFRKES